MTKTFLGTNVLLLCFVFRLKTFIQSIPSSTKGPQVYENCEVKIEVYCLYLELNILYIYIYYIYINYIYIYMIKMNK